MAEEPDFWLGTQSSSHFPLPAWQSYAKNVLGLLAPYGGAPGSKLALYLHGLHVACFSGSGLPCANLVVFHSPHTWLTPPSFHWSCLFMFVTLLAVLGFYHCEETP